MSERGRGGGGDLPMSMSARRPARPAIQASSWKVGSISVWKMRLKGIVSMRMLGSSILSLGFGGLVSWMVRSCGERLQLVEFRSMPTGRRVEAHPELSGDPQDKYIYLLSTTKALLGIAMLNLS